MPTSYKPVSCSEQEREELERLAHDSTHERLALRCQMVLQCLDHRQIKDIAEQFHERPSTVILWRKRFESEGITGLNNRPRGKPDTLYNKAEIGAAITRLLQEQPPKGAHRWTCALLAQEIGVPSHVVWRSLDKQGIKLSESSHAAHQKASGGSGKIEKAQEDQPEEVPATAAPMAGTTRGFSLELPVAILFEVPEEGAESHWQKDQMDLAITCCLTGKEGKTILKTVHIAKVVPQIDDFELIAREPVLTELDKRESPGRI